MKQKSDLQQEYLRTFKRKKSTLTTEELSKLEFLQIDFFATITQIADLRHGVDLFEKNKKIMEGLVDDLPLDHEKWYRFQLEKINSRLPRCDQGVKDSQWPESTPDK